MAQLLSIEAYPGAEVVKCKQTNEEVTGNEFRRES